MAPLASNTYSAVFAVVYREVFIFADAYTFSVTWRSYQSHYFIPLEKDAQNVKTLSGTKSIDIQKHNIMSNIRIMTPHHHNDKNYAAHKFDAGRRAKA